MRKHTGYFLVEVEPAVVNHPAAHEVSGMRVRDANSEEGEEVTKFVLYRDMGAGVVAHAASAYFHGYKNVALPVLVQQCQGRSEVASSRSPDHHVVNFKLNTIRVATGTVVHVVWELNYQGTVVEHDSVSTFTQKEPLFTTETQRAVVDSILNVVSFKHEEVLVDFVEKGQPAELPQVALRVLRVPHDLRLPGLHEMCVSVTLSCFSHLRRHKRSKKEGGINPPTFEYLP